MAAVNGCLSVTGVERRGGAAVIAAERLTALYLIRRVLGLVHAGLRRRRRALGTKSATGAPMLAPLTEACVRAFRRASRQHYGSTEI